MTNYIINPSTFYWFNVFSGLKEFTTVFACFCIVGTAACIGIWIYNYTQWIEYERERYKKYARMGKCATIGLGIASIILVAAAIFLPDKETSVEILVAQTLTHDNVNWTIAQVKEIIDYVIKNLGR